MPDVQALGNAMRSVRQIVDGVRLEAVRGRVLDAQVWSETHVKGSGSAIMVKGIGAGSSKTTSTVVNRREVCIEAEDGLQIVEAFDARVTLMPGQDVTLIRAHLGGKRRPVTVGVYNHSTREAGLTGYDMFPRVLFLLKCSIFVSILALVVMAMGAGARNPNGFLLIGSVLLAGNVYWFRGLPILRGFEKRVQAAMDEAAQAPRRPAPALQTA